MNIIKYPSKAEWGALLERPHRDASELRETVQTVLDQIRQYGDSAVKAFEERFDKVRLESLAVSEEEIAEAELLVSDDLKEALKLAHANIEKFLRIGKEAILENGPVKTLSSSDYVIIEERMSGVPLIRVDREERITIR